jgi:hypothetical protein
MRESLEDGCLACSSFGNPELLRYADSLKLSGLQTLLKVPGSTCVANTARAALKDVQAVALIIQRARMHHLAAARGAVWRRIGIV